MFILFLQFSMFALTPILLDRGLSRCLAPKYATLATVFIVLVIAAVGAVWGMLGLYWIGYIALAALSGAVLVWVWYLIIFSIFLGKEVRRFGAYEFKTFVLLVFCSLCLLCAAILPIR